MEEDKNISPRELGETIRKRREASGMNQRQLAAMVGIRHTHVSRLERGESGASLEVLSRIASSLGVTIDQLTGSETVPPVQLGAGISDEEAALVRRYREAGRGDRRAIMRFAELCSQAAQRAGIVESIEEYREAKRSFAAPVAEPHREAAAVVLQFIDAAAGVPLAAEAVPEEMEVPAELVDGHGKKALVRARGDSMQDIGINDRDVLLVEIVTDTKNYAVGDVVVARVNDSEYIVKRYGGARRKSRIFRSEHSGYEDLVVPTGSSIIEGKVLARRAPDGAWVAVKREGRIHG